jgi:hypothetical protein
MRLVLKGMHGATYKRIALLYGEIDDRPAMLQAYQKALEGYREAMDEAGEASQKYYWYATQVLSLEARAEGKRDRRTFELAQALAQRDTEAKSVDADAKAWAHGTLAELALLGAYHLQRAPKAGEIEGHCAKIVALAPSQFHIDSTLRQFERYRHQWSSAHWRGLPERAIAVLKQTIRSH